VTVTLRRLPLIMLVWLLAQFLLGMALNLFVVLSTNHPGSNPPEYFSGVVQSVTWAILDGPVLLVLHASMGLLLVLGSAGVIVQAVRSGPRSFAAAAIVGGVSILAAGFNGGSFLNYRQDFSSMLMAAFFAVAVAAYGFALYFARPA
jgi:hypothetical protein